MSLEVILSLVLIYMSGKSHDQGLSCFPIVPDFADLTKDPRSSGTVADQSRINRKSFYFPDASRWLGYREYIWTIDRLQPQTPLGHFQGPALTVKNKLQ